MVLILSRNDLRPTSQAKPLEDITTRDLRNIGTSSPLEVIARSNVVILADHAQWRLLKYRHVAPPPPGPVYLLPTLVEYLTRLADAGLL